MSREEELIVQPDGGIKSQDYTDSQISNANASSTSGTFVVDFFRSPDTYLSENISLKAYLSSLNKAELLLLLTACGVNKSEAEIGNKLGDGFANYETCQPEDKWKIIEILFNPSSGQILRSHLDITNHNEFFKAAWRHFIKSKYPQLADKEEILAAFTNQWNQPYLYASNFFAHRLPFMADPTLTDENQQSHFYIAPLFYGQNFTVNVNPDAAGTELKVEVLFNIDFKFDNEVRTHSTGKQTLIFKNVASEGEQPQYQVSHQTTELTSLQLKALLFDNPHANRAYGVQRLLLQSLKKEEEDPAFDKAMREFEKKIIDNVRFSQDCKHMDLSTVELSGIDISGKDLTGADLTGADLTGTFLDEKTKITKDQLSSAHWDYIQYIERNESGTITDIISISRAQFNRIQADSLPGLITEIKKDQFQTTFKSNLKESDEYRAAPDDEKIDLLLDANRIIRAAEPTVVIQAQHDDALHGDDASSALLSAQSESADALGAAEQRQPQQGSSMTAAQQEIANAAAERVLSLREFEATKRQIEKDKKREPSDGETTPIRNKYGADRFDNPAKVFSQTTPLSKLHETNTEFLEDYRKLYGLPQQELYEQEKFESLNNVVRNSEVVTKNYQTIQIEGQAIPVCYYHDTTRNSLVILHPLFINDGKHETPYQLDAIGKKLLEKLGDQVKNVSLIQHIIPEGGPGRFTNQPVHNYLRVVNQQYKEELVIGYGRQKGQRIGPGWEDFGACFNRSNTHSLFDPRTTPSPGVVGMGLQNAMDDTNCARYATAMTVQAAGLAKDGLPITVQNLKASPAVHRALHFNDPEDMKVGLKNAYVRPLPKNTMPGDIIAHNVGKLKCLLAEYESRKGNVHRAFHGTSVLPGSGYSTASFLTTKLASFFGAAYSADDKFNAATKALEIINTADQKHQSIDVNALKALPPAARQGELGKCINAIIEAQASYEKAMRGRLGL